MTGDSSSSRVAAPFMVDRHALFLDFDGTLAPLQDDPDTVALPPYGARVLLDLQKHLRGAMVLISGRDIRDLSLRTPQAVMRAGGHGLETCEAGEKPAASPKAIAPEILSSAAHIVDQFDQVRIEEKGPVIAIHFRQNPSVEDELVMRFKDLAETIDGYKAQHGKMVIELKPLRANKGIALQSIMKTQLFAGRVPIMVGDDVTDEDAMQAAIDLGGYGIKVGSGTTLAKHRFIDPEGVWAWLRSIANEHA